MKKLNYYLTALFTILGTLSLSPLVAHARDARCTTVVIPMTIEGLGNVQMVGDYCLPKNNPNPNAALFFAHGSSNNRSEYDFPFQQKFHSRVEIATDAGYAVLNVDRIGSGDSTIPAFATDVTFDRVVNGLHQALVALRTGNLRTANGMVVNTPVSKIACSGASLSTVYMWALGSQYNGDCQAIFTNGAPHGADAAWFPGAISLGKNSFPANLDPSIARPDLPDGYTTTLPPGYDTCAPFDFYNGPCDNYSEGWNQRFFIDPLTKDNVVAYDNVVAVAEANKGFTSETLVIETAQQLFVPPGSNISTNITVPVAMFAGAFDWATCGQPITATQTCTVAELLAHETPYFPNTTFDVFLVQGPHYMHLAPDYRDTFMGPLKNWLVSHGIAP